MGGRTKNWLFHKSGKVGRPQVITTPLWQWGFRQCLPFSINSLTVLCCCLVIGGSVFRRLKFRIFKWFISIFYQVGCLLDLKSDEFPCWTGWDFSMLSKYWRLELKNFILGCRIWDMEPRDEPNIEFECHSVRSL